MSLLRPFNMDLKRVHHELRDVLNSHNTLIYNYAAKSMIPCISVKDILNVFYYSMIEHRTQVVCTLKYQGQCFFAYIDVNEDMCCVHVHVHEDVFISKCLPLELSMKIIHPKLSFFQRVLLYWRR